MAVLHGRAGVFCAGADLKAFSNRVEPDGDGPMGPTRMRLGKPVIAAVEGYAVAGGLELALWCDLRVAGDTATFGVFCRRWGVPLIDGGTVRLPRLIGHSRAMDLILTGRAVDAAEAERIGLVNRVLDAESRDAFLEQVLEYARQFTKPGKASLAVGNIKRACQSGGQLPIEQGLALERELQALLFNSGDAKEGLNAYVEKRQAAFSGR